MNLPTLNLRINLVFQQTLLAMALKWLESIVQH